MIGNAVRRHAGGRLAEPDGPKEFADVAGERGDLLGPPRHAGLAREQMAVILHSRAASRSIDDEGVEPACANLFPSANILPCKGARLLLASHMQIERAAAARSDRDHYLAAVPPQQPDGRGIDIAIKRLLRAAGE